MAHSILSTLFFNSWKFLLKFVSSKIFRCSFTSCWTIYGISTKGTAFHKHYINIYLFLFCFDRIAEYKPFPVFPDCQPSLWFSAPVGPPAPHAPPWASSPLFSQMVHHFRFLLIKCVSALMLNSSALDLRVRKRDKLVTNLLCSGIDLHPKCKHICFVQMRPKKKKKPPFWQQSNSTSSWSNHAQWHIGVAASCCGEVLLQQGQERL